MKERLAGPEAGEKGVDEIVGIENAGKIYSAAKHPKSFHSLAGADHLLTKPTQAKYAAGIIAAWSDRFA